MPNDLEMIIFIFKFLNLHDVMEIPEDKNIIEVSGYWTWMGDDGIARTKVKPGIDITIDEAKENTEAVNSLNHDTFPLLVDSTGIKSMSKEARDHFSINNRGSRVTAFAVIVNSPLSKVIGNFFMGLNKPRIPAKLFTDESQALNWLKEYL